MFTGCDKNEDQLATIEPQKNEVSYIVRDGYLAFDSRESFTSTINSIGNLNDIERSNWENKIGFLSQQSIVNNLINDELIKDSLNRIKYANADLSKVSKREYHSDYYYEVLSKGVIKLIDAGTQDEYWDYAVFDRSSTQYINEEGLFAIADTLYQVTNRGLKSIALSAQTNKENLLKKLAHSDKIISRVSTQTDNTTSDPTKGEIWAIDWAKTGSWPSVQRRIRVGIELTFVEFIISTQRIEFKHNFFVKCQKTNFFNNWIYDWTTVVVNGSWKISVYQYAQYYENSFSYTTNCSDLKGCVNPETGVSAPYGTNFLVYPNETNSNVYWEYNYGYYLPTFANYNWTAKRTDVNLTSTLSYNY